MTIRCRDEAELWLGTSSLWLDDQPYEVEEQRGYKDRWVVKLAGIDDANDAAQLRGATVTVEREAAPQLGSLDRALPDQLAETIPECVQSHPGVGRDGDDFLAGKSLLEVAKVLLRGFEIHLVGDDQPGALG